MDSQMQLLLTNIKEKMDSQTIAITEAVTTSVMKQIDEKLKLILEENKGLKVEVQRLNEKIKNLESEKKGNNLVIFGLEEDRENGLNLIEMLVDTMIKTGFDITKQDINKAFRIGVFKGTTRPVLISFVNAWKRNEILRNKKKLPKNISIKEDFTKEVLEKRKELLPILEEERKKGRIAFIKQDKLIVKDKGELSRDKRKREPTSSPKEADNATEQIKAPQKINKINAFHRLYRGRSQSNLEHKNE